MRGDMILLCGLAGFEVGSLGADESSRQKERSKEPAGRPAAKIAHCRQQELTRQPCSLLANLKVPPCQDAGGSEGVNLRVEIDFAHLELAALMSGVFHALGAQGASSFKLSDLGGVQLASNRCLEPVGPRVKATLDCKWLAELVALLSSSRIFAGQPTSCHFAHGKVEASKSCLAGDVHP